MENVELIDPFTYYEEEPFLEVEGLINPLVKVVTVNQSVEERNDVESSAALVEIHNEAGISMPQVKMQPSLQDRFFHNVHPVPAFRNPIRTTQSAQKLLPKDVADWFLSHFSLRLYRDKLYMFGQNSYKHIDENRFCTLAYEGMHLQISMEANPLSLMRRAYGILKHDSRIMVADDYETPTNYVACKNGVINLDTGILLAPTPDLFLTSELTFQYQFEETPNFDRYLSFVTNGDTELMTRIYEILGYCLVPDTGGKKVFICQGVHDSGKSILIYLLESIFSESDVCHLGVEALGGRFDIVNYADKLLCVSPDMSSEALNTTAVSKVKKLSGHDTITADVKNKSHISFRFKGKMILVSNFPIKLTRHDDAFYERCIAVPFFFSVPRELRDPHLPKKLVSEKNGIAFKAIQAYFALRQRNYQFTGSFPLNDPRLFPEMGVSLDPLDLVETYVRDRFKKLSGCIISTEVIYDDFLANVGEAKRGPFSMKLYEAAARIHGAHQTRKRVNGEKNARFCIEGMAFAD